MSQKQQPQPRQLLAILRRSERALALAFPTYGEANRYRLKLYGDRRKYFPNDNFLAQSTFSMKGHPAENPEESRTKSWLLVAEGPQEALDLTQLQLLDPNTGEPIPPEEIIAASEDEEEAAFVDDEEGDFSDLSPWNIPEQSP